MAFGSSPGGDQDGALAEINMVPFIDVMLVLLIIFMVTAPLLTHAVRIELPRATSTANRQEPQYVQIAIDMAQQIYWNGERVADIELEARLREAGSATTPPELQLQVEKTTPYERVATLMSMAAKHGVRRISFVTDPSLVP